MKHNVNFLLFGLVVLSLLFMIFMAFYYQKTYQDLNDRYDSSKKDILTKAEELNKTISEVNAKEALLNQKESVLSDYISELNLSKERETSLGSHFIDLKNEKVYLEEKLNKTLQDRDKWRTFYDTTKKDFDVCKMDYQLERDRSLERLNEITRIRNLKPSMELNAQRIGERESDVSSNVKNIDDLANEIDSLADGINDSTLRDSIKSKANSIKTKASATESALDKLMENLVELQYVISRI